MLLIPFALLMAPQSARAQAAGAWGNSRNTNGSSFSRSFQEQHRGPVNVSGHHFTYNYKADEFVVTGNAVVIQDNTTLSANKIDLLRRQRSMSATGDVHLVDPLGRMTASHATLNLDNETATLINGKILSKDKIYRLDGKKIEKLEGQHYRVNDGFFTTCTCERGTPDWSITANEMDLHMGETGVARGARFNVLGYPILYAPYFTFPADTDRHSGFLSPRVGESGLRGFQLLEPYYLDINKSSDASLAGDIETSQRVGLLGEYRLINGEGDYLIADGAFYDESIRSESNRQGDIIDSQIADPHIPVDRYDIIGMMRQHITPNLVLFGDGTSVSDSLELREMNVWTLSRTVGSGIFFPTFPSMRNAMSDFGALYSFEDGYARAMGIWNQDLIQPAEFELQSLPQLLISGRHELLGGLAYTDFNIEGDNFYRAEGIDGLRLDLAPNVTVPWRLGDFLYGWGTLGVRETAYDVSGHQIEITPVGTEGRQYNNKLELGTLAPGGLLSREMIYGSAGVRSDIEKVYQIHGKYVEALKHTVEPFAYYAYVPAIDQSDLPLFDQIDRIEPRSLITYGVTSRFYVKLPPILLPNNETSAASEGEPSTLSPFRARTVSGGSSVEELAAFTLEQAYDTDHAIAFGSQRFSDLQASAQLFPTRVISLGGTLGINPQADQISYATAEMNFQPWWTQNISKLYMGKAETGSFLQVAYVYIGPGPADRPGTNANFNESLVLRAYYDLFDRLGVYYAPSYDFASGKMLEQSYGVRIKSPCNCWAFDTGITESINPSETSVQFQLTLGGLGSIGQSPFGRNPFQIRTGVLPYYH
ncbi:MAG: LPS-assembly protein LptD [Candidatus Binataceae bacterium]